MTKYSIVIPAYNEEESIKNVLGDIRSVMNRTKKSYEIIVVNDASTDNTENIVSKSKEIKIITHERNQGYGASLKDGIRKARGEWIIITDSDGTYFIKDITKLLKHTNGHDMIIGARKSKNVPLLRRPAKWILKRVSNYITNTRIPDLNSGLRVFRKDLAYRFWNLFPDGFSFTTTITIAALCSGYEVKYININYLKRKGKSSIHPTDFIGFIKILSKIALYFRPLKIFFPVSVIIFLLGVLRGIRDFIVTNSLGELSVILVMVSIQILFFGFLAELVIQKLENKVVI